MTHKRPPILPKFASPAPTGYISIGCGGTFITDGPFEGMFLCSLGNAGKWKYGRALKGTAIFCYYAVPIDSKIHKIQPWYSKRQA